MINDDSLKKVFIPLDDMIGEYMVNKCAGGQVLIQKYKIGSGVTVVVNPARLLATHRS